MQTTTQNTDATKGAESLCTRMVSIPILKPADETTWEELGKALTTTVRRSVAATNAVMGSLYSLDCTPERLREARETGKTPSMKGLGDNGYRVAREAVPDLPTGAASAIARDVRAKWTGKIRTRSGKMLNTRWAVMHGLVSTPSYSSCPIPVRAQELKLHEGRGGELLASFPLSDGEGGYRRYEVILKTGAKRGERRQAETIRSAIRGEIKYGAAKIIQKNKAGKTIWMLALAVKVPKREVVAGQRLLVRTMPDAILAASWRGRKDWIYNGDHIRHRLIARDRQTQRLREDMKAEPRESRGGAVVFSERQTTKHDRWIKQMLHEIASNVVAFAERNGRATLVYDDSCRDFLSHFGYFRLEELIKEKSDARGVAFEKLSELRAAGAKRRASDDLLLDLKRIEAAYLSLGSDGLEGEAE